MRHLKRWNTRHRVAKILMSLSLAACAVYGGQDPVSPDATPEGAWALIWSDEFNEDEFDDDFDDDFDEDFEDEAGDGSAGDGGKSGDDDDDSADNGDSGDGNPSDCSCGGGASAMAFLQPPASLPWFRAPLMAAPTL